MNKPAKVQQDELTEVPLQERSVCGIVMPISAMGDYDEAHWLRVRLVLERAVGTAGFKPKLVSESEEIAVIQESIVQNLYDNEIVVVDVSGKNPNVMFELGLRLAFDKPTVIIKDDATSYNFDTSPIKHINYRRDLRFDDVERLQRDVAAAIRATVAKKESDKDYSPFLKTFGKIKVANLETKEVNSSEFIIDQLQNLRKEVARLSDINNSIKYDALDRDRRIAERELEDLVGRLVLTGNYDFDDPSGMERLHSHLSSELRKKRIAVSRSRATDTINRVIENLLSGTAGKG